MITTSDVSAYPAVIFDDDGTSYRQPVFGTLGFAMAEEVHCTICHTPLLWIPPHNRLPVQLPFCSLACVDAFNKTDSSKGRR